MYLPKFQQITRQIILNRDFINLITDVQGVYNLKNKYTHQSL